MICTLHRLRKKTRARWHLLPTTIGLFKPTILGKPSYAEAAAQNMTLNKHVNKAKDRQKNSNTTQTIFQIKRNNSLSLQKVPLAFLNSQLPNKMNKKSKMQLLLSSYNRAIVLDHLASSIIVIARKIQLIKKPAKLLIKIRTHP